MRKELFKNRRRRRARGRMKKITGPRDTRNASNGDSCNYNGGSYNNNSSDASNGLSAVCG